MNSSSRTSTSKSPGAVTLNRKIKDVKQYTVDEGQKVNESLKNYQAKFEKQLKSLYKNLDEKFKTETQYQKDEIQRGNDRM